MTPDSTTAHGREWWLCSHLVHLRTEKGSGPSQPVVLEEIHAGGARVAVDEPCQPGRTMRLTAEGLDVRCWLVDCRVREDDFLWEVRFLGGFEWNTAVWRPRDLHLPRVPEAEETKAAGAGD
jgi:hypothetical protein